MKKKIIYMVIITLIIIGILVSNNVNKKEIMKDDNANKDIMEKSKETELINNDFEFAEGGLITDVNNVENNTIKQEKQEYIKTQKNKNSKTNVNNKSNNTIKQNKQVVTVEPKKEEKKLEIVKQQEEKQQTNTEKKEEFKVNNQMTQKIVNIINTNQSEYMKQYGFNVVIDGSIVNQTSQFTFTQQRVKDKIIYKFGTIKVYAQDYYVNGQYVWTECYII